MPTDIASSHVDGGVSPSLLKIGLLYHQTRMSSSHGIAAYPPGVFIASI